MLFNIDSESAMQTAKQIRLLLLDVDGVLTDGKLYFSNSGEESKAFSTLDGHGIKMLRKAGVEVGIITGRESQLVARRAADLGIEILVQGREDKLTAMQEVSDSSGIAFAEISFVGDDLPDLSAMQQCALPISVPGGHPDVRHIAAAVTETPGGSGAVREVTDFLLTAKGQYPRFD